MQKNIPTFQFYGEYLADEEASPIHLEAIKERSLKHNWDIRPHRHEKLLQLFYLQHSGVEIKTVDKAFTTSEPTVFLAPPMTVHGFSFPENTVGDVISLRIENETSPLHIQLSSFEPGTAIIFSAREARHFKPIIELIGQFRTVYREISQERTELLSGMMSLILRYVSAETHSHLVRFDSSTDQSLHEQQVQKFCNQVEELFREPVRIEDIAGDLGFSAPHLTRISNKILGCSPNEFVRRRRIVEAKRLLQFTKRSVQDVATRSGFRDVGYFSRSFKASVGQTPGGYRRKFGN